MTQTFLMLTKTWLVFLLKRMFYSLNECASETRRVLVKTSKSRDMRCANNFARLCYFSWGTWLGTFYQLCVLNFYFYECTFIGVCVHEWMHVFSRCFRECVCLPVCMHVSVLYIHVYMIWVSLILTQPLHANSRRAVKRVPPRLHRPWSHCGYAHGARPVPRLGRTNASLASVSESRPKLVC